MEVEPHPSDPSAGSSRSPDDAPPVAMGFATIPPRTSLTDWYGWDWISLGCFGLCNAVMLLTLRDYGFTYDEPPHIRYGERILDFYASGFTARSFLQTSYVGGFDLIAALLRRISPFDMFVTNHVLCIFVAQCGLLGTWKLGRLLGGRLGGLCAWSFLVLTPVYYSHQFNNPKDVPFAAGYIWGLYWIAKLLVTHERSSQDLLRLLSSPKYFIQLGVVLGLAMSVRVGGVLLIGYLAVALVAVGLERWWRKLEGGPMPKTQLVVKLVLALGIAWAILLVCWPKAFVAPVQGPAAAVESVTHYKAFDSPTLLRGKLVSSHRVPWDYLPTYFAVQLPELTSLALLGAAAWCGRKWWFSVRRAARLPLSLTLVMMAIFLPPTYAIVRGSVLYDGLRHFLFIIPPISVASGVALTRALSVAAQSNRRWLWGLTTVVALFLIDQAHALVATHPYQHVHFNRSSGGTKPAIKRYETEYYGALYQELGHQVAQAMWQNDRAAYLNRSYGVAACGLNLFVNHNFPVNFQYYSMGKAKRADLFASYPRDRCLERLTQFPLVVEIRRAGATLGVARDLKGVFTQERGP